MAVKRVPLQAAAAQLGALKIFADSNGDVIAHAGVKVGSFTRDLSTPNGTQSVTGVGFHPSAVIFFACVNDTKGMSVGMGDGVSMGCVIDGDPTVKDVYLGYSIFIIDLYLTAANAASAVITSLDTDGFTITWSKSGSPTGVCQVFYLSFR